MKDQISGLANVQPKVKRRISAGNVMRDIRSGLHASELMRKYRVSAVGFRRILRKLIEAKVMSQTELDSHDGLYAVGLAARSLRTTKRSRVLHPLEIFDARDPVWSGRITNVCENGLRMEGIRTSLGARTTFMIRPRAMCFSPIVFEGTCRWVTPPKDAGDRWVSGIEITHISELDSVMFRELLQRTRVLKNNGSPSGPRARMVDVTPPVRPQNRDTRPCGSQRALHNDAPRLRSATEIARNQILEDIRSGMTDREIMEKRTVSPEGLQRIFRKLLDDDAITPAELRRRTPIDEDSLTLDLDGFMFNAETLGYPIPVFDAENPEVRGEVYEIGANALATTGIEVTAGQVKTLVVACGELLPVAAFSLVGWCRWCKREGPEQVPIAGFEFVDIPEETRPHLNELVRLVKI